MAGKEKQYFWIKLKKDFFNRKEMKRLRRIAGGDTYTVIYLKLLLLSTDTGGAIYFDGVGDDFTDELALDIDEDPENIKVTLTYLEKIGLMEIITDEEYFLNELPDMIGKESASTSRVRRYREKKRLEEEKKKELENKTVTCNADETQGNGDVTKRNTELELELDLEKELEKDVDVEQEKKSQGSNNSSGDPAGHIDIEQDLKEMDERPVMEEAVNPVHTYEQVYGILPTAKVIQELNGYLAAGMESGAVCLALEKAAGNGQHYGYARGILSSWEDKKIFTRAQAEAEGQQERGYNNAAYRRSYERRNGAGTTYAEVKRKVAARGQRDNI